MGVNISETIKTKSSCYNCCVCDSCPVKYQKMDSHKYDNNNLNYINNLNTFEVNDKINSFSPEEFEKMNKNKLKKIFLEKHVSSMTNSTKPDLMMVKVLEIQSYIRGYLLRKKFLQRIIYNKLNNIKTIKEKDNEDQYIDTEDNLVISLSMNGTIFTGDNSCKSTKSFKCNSNNELSRFLVNKNILSFNLKSKNNMKYKYFGFLKKINNNNKFGNYISTSGIVRNSNIIDTKIKSGFGKILFNDKTVFKCHFIENKANGIGQYIDTTNNEEFIGDYKNNVPNGFGIYRNLLGERKCLGYFKYNSLNGIGIEESIEDGYTYYGEFELNKKHGYGKLEWKEGLTYEGQFYRNQMNGYAIIKFPENKIYKGQMNNGKMEGFGEFCWGMEKKYFGYYKNDKRNGFGIFLWNIPFIKNEEEFDVLDKNKIKGYIGFWNDGNMNGVGLKISDGKIKYGIWKNGVKVEWIEGEKNIKKYMQNKQKIYSKIILNQNDRLINLLKLCIVNDDIFDEIEFEIN